MKTIYARSIERGYQIFFLWLFVEFCLGSLAILAVINKHQNIAMIISNVAVWLLPLAIFAALPLCVAYLFERQKGYKAKYSPNKQFGQKGYINPALFICTKLACIMCDKLYLSNSNYYENEGENSEEYAYSKPEFSHIVFPLTYLVKRIIRLSSRVVNRNRGEPIMCDSVHKELVSDRGLFRVSARTPRISKRRIRVIRKPPRITPPMLPLSQIGGIRLK
jgi:hypothetical protein